MATVLDRSEEPGKHFPAAANDGGDGYRPRNDEPFMNPRQQEYFREKLLAWKDAIYREGPGWPDAGVYHGRAAALARSGFEVIKRINLGQAEMVEAARAFGYTVRALPKNDSLASVAELGLVAESGSAPQEPPDATLVFREQIDAFPKPAPRGS